MKNYKKILILCGVFVGFMSSPAISADGYDLIDSQKIVFASIGENLDGVVGWRVTKSDQHTTNISVLNRNGEVQSFKCEITDDCKMVSTRNLKDGIKLPKDADGTNADKAQSAAFNTLEKFLKRKGEDLSTVYSYKTWIDIKSANQHGPGADIWTFIEHTLGGKNVKVYIMCHLHGRDDYVCHPSRKATGEIKW